MTRSLADIAASFEETAVLMDLAGENPFKVRAHANAARVVESWGDSVTALIASAKEGGVRGLGPALSQKLEIFSTRDSDSELDALKKSLPPGLFDMLKVPGLGPKKVRALWDQLSIVSLEALEQACRKGEVAKLKGFGKKTEEKILEGIERLKTYADQFLFPVAWKAAEALRAYLVSHPACISVEVCGSLRRRKEVVKDIDLVAASDKPAALIAHAEKYTERVSTIARGDTKLSLTLQGGLNADIRVVTEKEFPTAINYFSGSKAHNTHLRARAQSCGLKLNEYGLYKGERARKISSEKELYEALALAYVPPELREDRGEIESAALAYAAQCDLPRLVERSDLRGIMHAHTTYSDGRNTLRDMAQAVKDAGYEYFVVTDHSRSAAYAGGLSIAQVRTQRREINKLNEEFAPFRIFHGIESDILVDGQLDYPSEVLSEFDLVIASVHSNFSMSEKDMTARLITAARNPYTTVMGHLTGRLLLQREGYPVNVPEVLRVCAAEGVAVELNANPHRLDLDWRHHALAVQLGISIPICPDAHGVEEIEYVTYGVGIARKGGLTPAHVLNCKPLTQFISEISR